MRVKITAVLAPEVQSQIPAENLATLSSEWSNAVSDVPGFRFQDVSVQFESGLTRDDLRNMNLWVVIIVDSWFNWLRAMFRRKEISRELRSAIPKSQLRMQLPSGPYGIYVLVMHGVIATASI